MRQLKRLMDAIIRCKPTNGVVKYAKMLKFLRLKKRIIEKNQLEFIVMQLL